jgi:hypothetical protein
LIAAANAPAAGKGDLLKSSSGPGRRGMIFRYQCLGTGAVLRFDQGQENTKGDPTYGKI